MKVETALIAIHKWFDCDPYEIQGVTTEASGDIEYWDQSETFLSVRGEQRQVGMEGDSFEGQVYFEFEPGKYIKARFW